MPESSLLTIGEVAKRAGVAASAIRYYEIAELLRAADEGHPTHEKLQQLARAKLPEIDALARRVRAMQRWLRAASTCTCAALDECELFTSEAFGPSAR